VCFLNLSSVGFQRGCSLAAPTGAPLNYCNRTYSNFHLRVKHFYFVAADKLYGEFLESLQSHGTEQQVFDIVSDFIQTCSDTLDVLRDMERKVSQKITPLSHVSVVLHLMACIYKPLHPVFTSKVLYFLSVHCTLERKESWKHSKVIYFCWLIG
jgi:hypothetical protein